MREQWIQDKRLKILSDKLRGDINATIATMDPAELLGNYIARVLSMQNQLDEYFGGKNVLPHLTAEQSKTSMELYLGMSDKLMRMLDRAGDCLVDSPAAGRARLCARRSRKCPRGFSSNQEHRHKMKACPGS
jgi:hypothetical protein